MVGAHGVNGYKVGTLTLWEKSGLMNWLIPGAYFLYTGTCRKLIAKFILIFCHCLLLLQMFPLVLFWGWWWW